MAKLSLPIGLIVCYIKIMAAQELSVTKKSRGRPQGRTKPETRPVRLPIELIKRLDAWILLQPDPKPSISEAIRIGLQDWLTSALPTVAQLKAEKARRAALK
jgi:hypothetical protein